MIKNIIIILLFNYLLSMNGIELATIIENRIKPDDIKSTNTIDDFIYESYSSSSK